jgi:hypothetical protein
MKRMCDLFCGRLGWSKAFLARGWKVVGFDLVEPPEIPPGFEFVKCDVLQLGSMQNRIGVKAQIFGFLHSWECDFICASSPCEEFSVHGMKHFFPNPAYPELGIRLFNHTRAICEESGVPYVMENVRTAQKFVGQAVHHCGAYYLWGSGVPPLIPPSTVKKALDMSGSAYRRAVLAGQLTEARARIAYHRTWSNSKARREATARVATIPPELASCVAEYAERLMEQRSAALSLGHASGDLRPGFDRG